MSVAKQARLPAAAPAPAGAWVDALWRRGLERVVYGIDQFALIHARSYPCPCLGTAFIEQPAR